MGGGGWGFGIECWGWVIGVVGRFCVGGGEGMRRERNGRAGRGYEREDVEGWKVCWVGLMYGLCVKEEDL